MNIILEPTPIASSQISRIGYSSVDRVLFVEFKNTKAVYCYYDLLDKVYKNLLKAPSIGKFIAREIIPNHYCDKVTLTEEKI